MMKDLYQQRSRKRWRVLSPSAVFFLTLLILLSILYLWTPDFFIGTARDLMRPFWSGERQVSASISNFVASFVAKGVLVEKNEALSAKLREASTLELENRALKAENTVLKALWGRSHFEEVILAPVLKRPSATPYDTLLIDVGKQGNVKVGNRVLADSNIVIGTITRLDGQTGTVRR